MKTHLKIFLPFSFIVSIIVIFIVFWNYQLSKDSYLSAIDSRLRVTALTLDLHLGKDFVDKYTKENPMDKTTHYNLMLELSEYAQNVGLEYIYIMVKEGNKVFLHVGNEQEETIQNKTYDPFMTEYKDASDEIRNGFFDGNSFVDEYEDKYGKFRSFFITQKSPKGRIYMIGSDVNVDEVHAKINEIALNFILAGFFILLLGILLSGMLSKVIYEKFYK